MNIVMVLSDNSFASTVCLSQILSVHHISKNKTHAGMLLNAICTLPGPPCKMRSQLLKIKTI